MCEECCCSGEVGSSCLNAVLSPVREAVTHLTPFFCRVFYAGYGFFAASDLRVSSTEPALALFTHMPPLNFPSATRPTK